MKVKIERVHYASLRNDEFPVVYEQTVSICEKHSVESLHLEKTFGELISFRSALESLTVNLRKNEKLARSSKVEVERDALINGVKRVVKGYEYIDLPEIRPYFEVLDALLTKHTVRTIAAASHAAETERLLLLETEVNASQPIQTAFAAFGLTLVVRCLFEANREYEVLFREYISEKSEEQRIDVSLLRKNCSKALVQFFDALQYSAYIYEDVDYTPLINELKRLNLYYIQQLKAHATRRKNGKKTNEEPSIPPMTEN
jgi:hypothetical protein